MSVTHTHTPADSTGRTRTDERSESGKGEEQACGKNNEVLASSK